MTAKTASKTCILALLLALGCDEEGGSSTSKEVSSDTSEVTSTSELDSSSSSTGDASSTGSESTDGEDVCPGDCVAEGYCGGPWMCWGQQDDQGEDLNCCGSAGVTCCSPPVTPCGVCPEGLECMRIEEDEEWGAKGHACSRPCNGVGSCDDIGMSCREMIIEGEKWPQEVCVATCTDFFECPENHHCSVDGSPGICLAF